jgi:hypothetical protein
MPTPRQWAQRRQRSGTTPQHVPGNLAEHVAGGLPGRGTRGTESGIRGGSQCREVQGWPVAEG